MTAPQGAPREAGRHALLLLDGWHGRSEAAVVIVGETPTRYRVTPGDGLERVRLGGRQRWLPKGETALVPKTAVRLPASAMGAKCSCGHGQGRHMLDTDVCLGYWLAPGCACTRYSPALPTPHRETKP